MSIPFVLSSSSRSSLIFFPFALRLWSSLLFSIEEKAIHRWVTFLAIRRWVTFLDSVERGNNLFGEIVSCCISKVVSTSVHYNNIKFIIHTNLLICLVLIRLFASYLTRARADNITISFSDL